jgi:hypothetical protein
MTLAGYPRSRGRLRFGRRALTALGFVIVSAVPVEGSLLVHERHHSAST